MNWDDSAARAELIERVGLKEYSRLQAEHLSQSVIDTVNGYDIRAINTRFGRLYHVDGAVNAYPSLDNARAYAEQLEPKS